MIGRVLALCDDFDRNGTPTAIRTARHLLQQFPSESTLDPLSAVLLLYARARAAEVVYDFNLSGSELRFAHETYSRATSLMREHSLEVDRIGDEIQLSTLR